MFSAEAHPRRPWGVLGLKGVAVVFV